MPTIPTMSLKTAQFTPAVFTPIQYEYQAADMGILERSLAQREARMKEAVQSKSAVDKALGELELKLNPSEAEWFEGYKQDIKNQIQSPLDSGDFGAAGREATRLAGEVFSDPRILGRIRSEEKFQEEFKAQQARRDKGEISQNTFDWWTSLNNYNYTDAKDANGNYVEGAIWQPKTPRPVEDMDFSVEALKAFKLITPKKGTTNRSGGKSTTNIDGTGEGNRWSNDSSFEGVSVEDVLSNIDDLLGSTSDGYRKAEQAFDVAKFDLKRLQQTYDAMPDGDPEKANMNQKLEARKKLMFKNGSLIDYKEYYARMITNNRYAGKLAYNWEVSDKSGFNQYDYQQGSAVSSTRSTSPSSPQQSMPWGLWDKWKGVNVRWSQDYDTQTLNSAASGISSRFESK